MPNIEDSSTLYQIKKISPTLNSFWYKLKFKEKFLYIHYDDLLEYKIVSGMSLTNGEFENLYSLYLKRKTQEKALARLAIKQRSTSEMKSVIKEIIYKLNDFNKHPSSPEINNQITNEIITYLTEKSYLNDDSFAENLIKKYLQGRKLKGPNYVKSMLIQKGISHETLNRLMLEYYTDSNENELKNASILIQKYSKKRKFTTATPQDQKAMITRFLMAQGYTFDIITKALKDS